MKVLAVSDNAQLAKLEDVAFLLGGGSKCQTAVESRPCKIRQRLILAGMSSKQFPLKYWKSRR